MEKIANEIDVWKSWKESQTPENNKRLLGIVDDRIEYAVKKYSNSGIPSSVLRTEAKKLALQQAKTFNPNAGANLNTHVSHGLRKMNDFVEDEKNTVRIPNYLRKQIPNFLSAKELLVDKLKREPSSLELADQLKIGRPMVRRLQSVVERKEIGETKSMLDVPNFFQRDEEEDIIKTHYYDLENDKDRVIFEYTFGIMGRPRLSPKEISSKVNMPEHKVRRSQHKMAQQIDQYYKR